MSIGRVLRAASGARGRVPSPAAGRSRRRAGPYQDTGTLQSFALRLEYMVGQITPEEFGWQDANYDRDSALGRELLFLIADNQWVRATSEAIDITRSDAVDTTIKIDIDLDRITHEAFRGRAEQLWLPVLVLPPLHQRLPEPDPFSTLTVADASGSPLVTLPSTDVRHRVAAALTEIILNVQAWLPDAVDRGFGATRDHRLLLSAAIYRLLRNEHVPTDVLERNVPPRQAADGHLPRIGRVRRELGDLLEHYSGLLTRPASQNGDSAARDEAFARRLTERAIMVLRAFAESAIVVVLADRRHTPTVLTVTVPGRGLHQAPARSAELAGPVTTSARRWTGPGLRRWLHPANWILPRASLQIDLLLPSADADRLVQVNLPEGVSPDPSRPLNSRAELEIRTGQPRPIRQLSELVAQLAQVSPDWPIPLSQSLADLAGAKAAAVRESLRDHRVGAAPGMPGITRKESTARTRDFRQRLDKLDAVLGDISAGGLTPAARRELGGAWGSHDSQGPGAWLEIPMQRRTATDTISPDIVVARSRMIEDASQRAAPTEARMQVHIAVTDSEYFSTSQFSGWMSVLLMTVVLAFFAAGRALAQDGTQVSAEVLAFVLTLFSAIQVGGIERPDRSTVRGMLAPAGNPLIIASILPTVILAVALAFSRTAVWAITWTGICICAQLLLLRLWFLMRRRALVRGRQQTADHQQPSGLTLYTDPPDYAHTDVLRSSWWRNTTADALMVGRQAYGYVVWQHRTPQTLRSLLQGGRPVTPANAQASWMPDWLRNRGALLRERLQATKQAANGSSGTFPDDDSAYDVSAAGTSPLEQPANVLALQRSSTGGQSLTFAVFRDEPKADWQPAEVVKVGLDPGRLAPVEEISGVLGVYIGLGRGQGLLPISAHPVTVILQAAARRRLTVLEVQLPLPAPTAAYTDLQWARVQLGLQDGDIKRLAPLLSDIQNLAVPANGQPHTGHHHSAADGKPPPALVIGVQTVAGGIPRILNPRPTAANPGPAAEQSETVTGSARLVLASDLDVVASSGVDRHESDSAKTWRVMAICADWHVGVESEILSHLDPELCLASLTAATLHGKAVLLLLAHWPGKHNHQASAAAGQDTIRPAGLTGHGPVYLDKWQSRLDLGAAERYPLLRVHMRTPDRSGATLEVLESLREALREMAPESLGERDWNVWYARVAVAHGNTAQIQLTVRLAMDPTMTPAVGEPITRWGSPEFSKIERQALAAAARKLTVTKASAGTSDPGFYAPEDTVISVGLVSTVELDRPQAPSPGASPQTAHRWGSTRSPTTS
jgi:hypothetical protein